MNSIEQNEVIETQHAKNKNQQKDQMQLEKSKKDSIQSSSSSNSSKSIHLEREEKHGQRLANKNNKKSYLRRVNAKSIEYDIDILKPKKNIDFDLQSSLSSSSSLSNEESSSSFSEKNSSNSDLVVLEKEMRHGKRLANPLKKFSYLSRQNCRTIEYTIDIASKSVSNQNSKRNSDEKSNQNVNSMDQNIGRQITKRTQDSQIFSKTTNNQTNSVHKYRSNKIPFQSGIKIRNNDSPQINQTMSQKSSKYSVRSIRTNINKLIKKYDDQIFKNIMKKNNKMHANDQNIEYSQNDNTQTNHLNLNRKIKKRETICEQIFELEEEILPQLKLRNSKEAQQPIMKKMKQIQNLYGVNLGKSLKSLKNVQKIQINQAYQTPIGYTKKESFGSPYRDQKVQSQFELTSMKDEIKSKKIFDYTQISSQKSKQIGIQRPQFSYDKFANFKIIQREKRKHQQETGASKERSNSNKTNKMVMRQLQIAQIYINGSPPKTSSLRKIKPASLKENVKNALDLKHVQDASKIENQRKSIDKKENKNCMFGIKSPEQLKKQIDLILRSHKKKL